MVIFDAALSGIVVSVLAVAVAVAVLVGTKVLPGPVALRLLPLPITETLAPLPPFNLPEAETPEIGKPACAHFLVKSDKKRKEKKIRLQTFDHYRQTRIRFTLSVTSDCAIAPMETPHCKHASKPLATEAVHRHLGMARQLVS